MLGQGEASTGHSHHGLLGSRLKPSGDSMGMVQRAGPFPVNNGDTQVKMGWDDDSLNISIYLNEVLTDL